MSSILGSGATTLREWAGGPAWKHGAEALAASLDARFNSPRLARRDRTSALLKSVIYLVLALAIGFSVHEWLSNEDLASLPTKRDAAAMSLETKVDEELDYLAARQIGSLKGWLAFLAAHRNSAHAQYARAEVERLRRGEQVVAPAATEAPNAAPQNANTSSPLEIEAAAVTPHDACKRDEDRLEQLSMSPSTADAARFANELSCERLRPQLMGLMASLDAAAQAPSAAPSHPVEQGPAQGSNAASNCASERDSLNRLRAEPSAEPAERFWRELTCELLRPQVRLLLESLDLAADSPTACTREAAELERVRANPDRREAERFVRAMKCDALKPQVARLLESLTD
jgi:hypothetical protein